MEDTILLSPTIPWVRVVIIAFINGFDKAIKEGEVGQQIRGCFDKHLWVCLSELIGAWYFCSRSVRPANEHLPDKQLCQANMTYHERADLG